MRSSHVLRVMLAVALVCPGTGQAQSLQSAPAAPVSPTDPAPAATTRQHLIKFNGEVRDALGQPQTGVVGITFALYAEQEGGAPLWLETQNVQLDAQGRYTVLLGATQSEGLPLDLFATGAARWLGLQVEVQQEQPRVLLVSVPYALKAKEAERLAGKSASEFLLVQDWQAQMQQEIQTQLQQGTKQQLAFPGIQPQAIIETGRSTFTDNNTSEVVFVEQLGTGRGLRALSAGTLGIVGQSSAASGASTGLRGTSTTSTVGAGLEGFANSPTGFTSGVKGTVQSTQGTAVSGLALATTGINFGVRGVSLSASGTGVLGRATATSGIARGVQGDTASPTGFGVFGLATDTTGNTTGVFGEVRSAGGTAGVFNNTAGGKLLSGTASGTEDFSLDSSGNLSAVGTLSAGAGNFTVDASGNVTATAFVGDGSGLTSLPAGTGDITSVNTAAGSGLSGGATSGDANLSLLTSCGANQLLKWDGASSWACAADIDTNSGGTVTSVTAGDASITIGGTATDPTVALAANSVDSSKIVNGTIVDADVNAAAAIARSKLSGTYATLEANTFNGAQELAETGTATTIQGFNSNPLDLTASAFDSGAVAAEDQLFRWQVDPVNNNLATRSGQLRLLFGQGGATPSTTGVVIESDGTLNAPFFVGDGSGLTGVTSSADSVTSAQIVDGTIATADLADSSVTSAKITDATVALADLAADSVDSSKIVDGTIVNADVNAAAAIARSKLSGTYATLEANTFTATQTAPAFAGDGASLTSLNATNIASGTLANTRLSASVSLLGQTIESAEISDGTIATADLADSSVTSAKITDGTVVDADINASGITTRSKLPTALAYEDEANSFTATQELAETGTATTIQGFNSNPLDLVASAFDSVAVAAEDQLFRWQVDPVDNNLATRSGQLSLLFGQGGATPAATGVTVSAGGTLNATAFVGDGSGLTGVTSAADSVTSAQIVDGTIATADLADSSVTSVKIADGTVALADLAANSVDSSKITDGSVALADLAADSVDSSKIVNATIVDADISAGAAIARSKLSGTYATLEANTFTGTQTIQTGAAATKGVIVQGAASQTANLQEWQNNLGTALASVDASGNLSAAGYTGDGSGLTSVTSSADSVTSAQIVDGTIATADLADSSVTSAKITDATIVDADINAAAAIARSKLSGTYATLEANTFTGTQTAPAFAGDGANLTNLDAGNLASGTLANTRLSASVSLLGASIESAEIADGTVALADLAADSVNSSKIVDATIVNADISGSAAIARSKLSGTYATLEANTFTATQELAETGTATDLTPQNRSSSNVRIGPLLRRSGCPRRSIL